MQESEAQQMAKNRRGRGQRRHAGAALWVHRFYYAQEGGFTKLDVTALSDDELVDRGLLIFSGYCDAKARRYASAVEGIRRQDLSWCFSARHQTWCATYRRRDEGTTRSTLCAANRLPPVQHQAGAHWQHAARRRGRQVPCRVSGGAVQLLDTDDHPLSGNAGPPSFALPHGHGYLVVRGSLLKAEKGSGRLPLCALQPVLSGQPAHVRGVQMIWQVERRRPAASVLLRAR